MRQDQKTEPESRRDDIALTALGIFLERGYSGTSMRAVADAAKIQKASLYHHFASKQELFLAALAADLAPSLDKVQRLIARADMAPRDKFRAALGLYYDAMVNSAIASIATVIAETSQSVPEVAEGFYDKFIVKFESSLADVYALCRSARTHRDVPIVHVTQIVFGPLLSIAMSNKMFAAIPRIAESKSKGRSRADFVEMIDGLLVRSD